MSTAPLRKLTPQEYLAIERRAESRSEFCDGLMCAMAGGSRVHNLLATNIATSLSGQLRNRPCEVYQSEMRVLIERTGLFTYPDVVVVRGKPELLDDRFDTLLNPIVLVEVLSESTEAYDRGRKFAHYQRMASLKEYVLVAQDELRVDRFTRRGDEWVLSSWQKLEDSLSLSSLGCEIPLAEVYRRTGLSEDTHVEALRIPQDSR
jgi:Uma2 family endonuclease